MHLRWFICCPFFLFACSHTPEAPAPESTGSVAVEDTTTAPVPVFHDCTLKRHTLQENEWWLHEQQILVTISADSTTYDKTSQSDSHRILEVYRTPECRLIFRQTLPVNHSPDFAYYIAKSDFETAVQWVLIRGFDCCYAYHTPTNRLAGPLRPKFSPAKLAGDAGSGSISDTRLWGHCLFGYAMDMGSFAFDMRDPDSPRALLPLREYVSEASGDMRGLYLIEVEKGRYQAIVPVYNFERVESDGLRLQVLFDRPRAIAMEQVNATSDHRNVLLKERVGDGFRPVGIDLEKASLYPFPAHATSLTDHALLKIMKGE